MRFQCISTTYKTSDLAIGTLKSSLIVNGGNSSHLNTDVKSKFISLR